MSSKTPNRIRFTEAVIARLEPPPEGEIIWWDSTTPTLGLRCSKTGRKTWTRGKRKLGLWPALSLKAARALMADEPTEPAKAPILFSEVVAQFLEHGRTRLGRPLRPTTLRQYQRILHGHAEPLHQLPFREITRADIARLTRKVATENGAPMASLLRAVLGSPVGVRHRDRRGGLQRRRRFPRLSRRQAQPRALRWRAGSVVGSDRRRRSPST